MKYLFKLATKLLPNKLFYFVSFFYLHIKGGGKIYIPKIDAPSSFNERMLNSRCFPRKYPIESFADKLQVRESIRELIGEHYLVPLLGVYETSDEIDFESLPQKFVIKTNHGSGWNIVCQDKKTLDIKKTKNTLSKWLKLNYYNIGREWQYKDIKPRVLVEQFLSNIDGSPINDFKIFCFNGKPHFVQVDLNRFTNHKRQFYNLNWDLQPFTTLFEREKNPLPRPENLNEMIEIAKKLSHGFEFVRIDLYNNGSQLYFGEITLHHGGGCEPFIPAEYDMILGELFHSGKNEN